jgi:hypothetical protein
VLPFYFLPLIELVSDPPFIVELLRRAASISVHSSLSTSYTSIFIDVAVGAYVLLRIGSREGGFKAVLKHWNSNLRDAVIAIDIAWGAVFSYNLGVTVPREIRTQSEGILAPVVKVSPPPAPPEPFHVTAKPVKPPAGINSSLIVKASVIDPVNPAIVVENRSDYVAQGVIWELVLFRARDLAFINLN